MNGNQTLQATCLNCDVSLSGTFCQNCGQRARDNSDRSLGQLLSDFVSNVFFFDNRFFLGIRYLILYPGRMTVEFLDGKRKKFISPVTLFLFLNLIYFLFSPLSDYSVALYDQIHSQPYSGQWVRELVDLKLQSKGISEKAYGVIYQNMTDNISKSIMIVNIPFIALFVHLMAYRKRRYYFDSLIFSFHYFSLYIFSWILVDWVDQLIAFLAGHDDTVVAGIASFLFLLGIPFVYAVLSIKKFMDIRWYWAIPAGLGVLSAVILSNMIYRFIILNLTLWFT